jgi:hypothetical protein
LAAELVSHQVTVITATGGEPSALAAKAATATIPIIFTLGGDPVAAGLVASLNRPGGNLTGMTIMALQMGPKRLELLRQLLPNATAMTMLINPAFPTTSAEARELQDAARSLGLQINVQNASTESQIDTAFTTIVQQRASALIVATDPFLLGQRDQLVRLAARHAIPTMYFLREFVEAGGLMSYGPNIANEISTGGRLHRPGSQRREACRPTSYATDKVRSGHQLKDHQGAGPHHAAKSACGRRRGDRIAAFVAAVNESVSGPSRHFAAPNNNVAIGATTDIDRHGY